MNLYFFVSITRHKFLSTCQIVVSKEFWRFFDAVHGFYINSAPESNRLFGGNGGCVYPLAFFHKPLRRLHYGRRGNSETFLTLRIFRVNYTIVQKQQQIVINILFTKILVS